MVWSPLITAPAAMLFGVGSGLAGPAPSAYLADVVRTTERTIAIGLNRTLGDAGAALAPPLLGGLADLGGYALPLFAAAILLVVVTGVFGQFAPSERSRAVRQDPTM